MTFIAENLFEIYKNEIIELSLSISEGNIHNLYNIRQNNENDLIIISLNENNPFNKEHIGDNRIETNKIFNKVSSIVFNKLMKPITYFRKIDFHNIFAKKYLESLEQNNLIDVIWKNLIFIQSYDGQVVQLFYNYNTEKWIVSSQHTIDASEIIQSLQTHTPSNNQLNLKNIFNEMFINKFDAIDKRFCYTFTILHNKYKNIVQYNDFGNNYKELILSYVSINNFIDESIEIDIKGIVSSCIKLEIKFPSIYNYSCYNEFNTTQDKINYDIGVYKKISTAGFIIYDPVNHKILEIQTNMFSYIQKYKSQFTNNYQLFLYLYQKDKLTEIIPYLSKFSNELIHRINISMKTLAHEFLNIYHTTRQKKNQHVYDALSDQFRKILYGIHGIYIKKRLSDFLYKNDKLCKTDNDLYIDSKSITVHDIYCFIKHVNFEQLIDVFNDRLKLSLNPLLTPYFDINCIYIITQTNLMYSLH